MNLYKSNISVLKSFSIHEQTLNTHTSDGTTKKLSNTQEKNKTTVLVGVCVCVANCVLVQCMALSINVAQGMGAKKQT